MKTKRKKIEAAIAEAVGGDPVALEAALSRRAATVARFRAEDAQERQRIKSALLTPQGARIDAINNANRKYAPGIHANVNKGTVTRVTVIAMAKKFLATNPRLSKSATAVKIGDATDAPCGWRQAKEHLDKAYTAVEWRKLAVSVTASAN